MYDKENKTAQVVCAELFGKLVKEHPEGIVVDMQRILPSGKEGGVHEFRLSPESISDVRLSQFVDIFNRLPGERFRELGVDRAAYESRMESARLVPAEESRRADTDNYLDGFHRKESEAQKEVFKAMNERLLGQQPIDDLLGVKGDVYGFAYDRAADYLDGVLRKLSEAVGWKGQYRPYDFDGFSGYYIERNDEGTDVCRGNEVVCSFFPNADGSLGFKAFGDEFRQYGEDVNPWYPLSDILDGRLCLEPANIERARAETHQGREVVYGLRFGEGCAYCVVNDDLPLRKELVKRDVNIRLVDANHFDDALERWVAADQKPGFEDAVRPELVRLVWDGAKLMDEREVALDQERDVQKGWTDDWELIDYVREKGSDIRRELQEAVGINDDRLFKFSTALYPNLGLRNDALFLSTDCGSAADFITVVRGKVALYRDYDVNKSLPEPAAVFKSVDDALSRVRKVILGPSNVQRAAEDYQKYLGEKLGQSREMKPSGPKL